jgi:uncharacterized protein (TIGR02145 family)
MKKMKKLLLPLLAILLTTACRKEKDDNPSEKFVTICSQTWMQKNLDVSTYRNGDPIPQVNNLKEWESLTTGAWCYYNFDAGNGKIYGKLYNWYAVNDPRGLAPVGWHVPTSDDLHALIDCLGGQPDGPQDGWIIVAGKLKATGTKEANTGLWFAPNTGATNSSKFTALPGGSLYFGENSFGFYNMGTSASWWTADGFDVYGDLFSVNYSEDRLYYFYYDRYEGHAVRCIKDN